MESSEPTGTISTELNGTQAAIEPTSPSTEAATTTMPQGKCIVVSFVRHAQVRHPSVFHGIRAPDPEHPEVLWQSQ
jgi:hypothetical protein